MVSQQGEVSNEFSIWKFDGTLQMEKKSNTNFSTFMACIINT